MSLQPTAQASFFSSQDNFANTFLDLWGRMDNAAANQNGVRARFGYNWASLSVLVSGTLTQVWSGPTYSTLKAGDILTLQCGVREPGIIGFLEQFFTGTNLHPNTFQIFQNHSPLISARGIGVLGGLVAAIENFFGYSFPCDGPGRGGTCDISAWDAFYLAVFWMLNTIGWVTFYWHWKHLTLWQGNVAQFDESSTYLMGWLRDYLWLNSSQLINGYNPFGMNSLSVWAWMFLFGHLIYATGFMFLISWRGYWQELIETLAWAHERTPLANLVRWRDKPVALSIVQARLVGLTHFSVGYVLTYAAFLIAATSGKFG